MGFFRWLKHLFGSTEKGSQAMSDPTSAPAAPSAPSPALAPPSASTPSPTAESVTQPIKPISQNEVKETTEWKGRLILTSHDVIQMARKLQGKGELYRAEQLLRDGVKEAIQNVEYWWLLVEIEEPLNRKGRAYYCIEQILQLDEHSELAQQKRSELQKLIDTDLSYFIEYKLAPEFYRLR